jgi:hypothetical protein
MPAHTPEECDLLLIEAIEKGDVDAMVALYEPNATFVVSPGQVVTGPILPSISHRRISGVWPVRDICGSLITCQKCSRHCFTQLEKNCSFNVSLRDLAW